MYVIPNLFKYIYFTYNLIEIEEDIIDYAVNYNYKYLSFTDITNDVKNDYNNIFFKQIRMTYIEIKESIKIPGIYIIYIIILIAWIL